MLLQVSALLRQCSLGTRFPAPPGYVASLGCSMEQRALRAPGRMLPSAQQAEPWRPVCRAGSRPDSWIAMAKRVSGLFKREACQIYVREWM